MTNSQYPDNNLSEEELLGSDFDWLANVYTRHGALNHPSELHGLMTGEVVGSLRRAPKDWIEQVLEHMGVEALDSERYANVEADLIAFYHKTCNAISDQASGFNLLLPDDDFELSERLDSLVAWVRGFLEGVAISASERLLKMGEDLQEILKDLVDVCQLDSRVVQSESGEKEFFEITEYVRMGVLNLYAELNPPQSASVGEKTEPDAPTLH